VPSDDPGRLQAFKAEFFKALAHPLRIRILAMLADHSASPVQLSSKLDATLGTVAYHVRTLHSLGLVELVDTRQRRGATSTTTARGSTRASPTTRGPAWPPSRSSGC
jgi:DNA-binding transcriptional ArsR family regulator